MYSLAASEPYDRLNQLLRKTVVGPQFFEISTLVPAREYNQQYEWSSHEVGARRAGVSGNVIDVNSALSQSAWGGWRRGQPRSSATKTSQRYIRMQRHFA